MHFLAVNRCTIRTVDDTLPACIPEILVHQVSVTASLAPPAGMASALPLGSVCAYGLLRNVCELEEGSLFVLCVHCFLVGKLNLL